MLMEKIRYIKNESYGGDGEYAGTKSPIGPYFADPLAFMFERQPYTEGGQWHNLTHKPRTT